MPVHDWSRVDAGMFHAFHTAWITHLSEALNDGVLPAGFYALPEQHGGRLIADILTLQAPSPAAPLPSADAGVAVAESPPRVRRKLSPMPAARASRRTVAVRHVSGHQVIALIEIVSPANKDRAAHVAEFADKVESALGYGVHVLMIDLFLPGTHDPHGMHGALWERFDDEPYLVPPGEPFTLASYVAGVCPDAYLEHVALGAPLPEMPLFLSAERYVPTPLETSYLAAFRGLPGYWRDVLSAPPLDH